MNQKYFVRSIVRAAKLFALVALFFVCAPAASAQNPDPKLSALRARFAVDYLKPEAHFALAKYYLDKNDKLQAFFILEYARRYRFPREDFDAAFVRFFGAHQIEPNAEAKTAFEEGYRLLKENKPDEAEKSFLKAARIAPESAVIQTWTGRFFYKARQNAAQALPFYFNAYFLDAHAYETEYVESRIRNISLTDADARFAELQKSGKSLPEISKDANPLIAGKAVEQMAKQWKKEYAKLMFERMSDDDSLVRWFAFMSIYKNADAAFDETLSSMLADRDLRKRGLAAYALIERRGENGIEILKKMLADDAELIRFDAASALALQGGAAGLEILRAHRKIETNRLLNSLIDGTLEKK